MTKASQRTQQLAKFIATADAAAMSQDLLNAVVPPVIDSVGVMLAGFGSDAGIGVRRFALEGSTGPGPGWVPGLPDGLSVEAAPLVNATMAHALDYDDAMPGAGHPAALVLAATLAAADFAQRPLSGIALAEAFVVGFETTVRVARAIGIKHYFRGWHTTCTAGSFGAAAAASKVLRLDEGTIAVALGLSASFASGIQRNFGTMTKPLHSGLAARNGVMAARLAAGGFTARADVFDGRQSFLELYGEGSNHPEAFDALGNPWALLDPGTALKKFPCCYAAARAIDGVLQLRESHGISADDVASINCTMAVGGPQALIYHRPETGLQGKFSMEYCLAAAMVDGEIVLDSFTDLAVRRPAVRELMRGVTVVEDPRCRPEDPQAEFSSPATGGFVEVQIVTRTGDKLEISVSHPPGSAKRPFSAAELEGKFLDCAAFGGFDTNQARSVVAELSGLLELDDVRRVLTRLSGPSVVAPSSAAATS